MPHISEDKMRVREEMDSFDMGVEESSPTFFDVAGKWVVYALIAVLPLFFIPSDAVPFQFSKSLFALVGVVGALLLVVIARLQQRQLTLCRSPVLWGVFGIAGATLLSAFMSGAEMAIIGDRLGTESAGFVLLGALLVLVVTTLFREKSDVLGSFVALLVGALAVALFYLLKLILPGAFPTFSLFFTPASGPLGAFSAVGMYFGFFVVIALIAIASLRLPRVPHTVLLVSLGIGLFFLALTNVRMVWWLVGFAALCTFIYSIMRSGMVARSALSNTGLFVSLVTITLSLVFLFGSPGMTGLLADYFGVGELDVRPSMRTTLDIGKATYKSDLFFGSGPGTFSQQWALHRPDVINQTIAWNVDFEHGSGYIPTAIVTTGVVGLVAWAFFLLAFIYVGLREFLQNRDTGTFEFFFVLASFSGALYLWILSILCVPGVVLILYAFFMTGLFLAALRVLPDGVQEWSLHFIERPRAGFLAVVALTVGILGALVSVFAVAERFAGSFHFQRSVLALNIEGNVERAAQSLSRALVFDERDTYYRFASVITQVQLNRIIAENPDPDEDARTRFQNTLAQAVQSAERAVALDSADYQNWIALGQVYRFIVPLGLEGAYDNAKRAFDEASRLRPNSPGILLEQAQLELATGSRESATTILSEALRLRPNYTDAMFLLAQIQLANDDVDAAVASVESAVALSPNNPVAFFQLGLLHYSTSRYDRAIQALERAVAIASEYANARYFLGLAYYFTGRSDDAIAQFEVIRQLNPDIAELSDIIENMRRGVNPLDGSPITQLPPVQPEPDVRTLDGLPISEQDPDIIRRDADVLTE